MGKVKGKHRLDKFYHLAKEQGYRSRAAFKLIQLDAKYSLLNASRSVLDLCAAPGGWMQVAVNRVPVGSLVVGIDLFPIRPIRGCISVEEDITKPKCRSTIKKLLAENGFKAFDLVLHDGSPNVGGAWAQEATSQNALVIDSVKLATEFLAPKGTFVTKVFRSQDYNAVHYCLRQLFEKVEVTKPVASRSTSAEIYVIGLKYKAPAKIDPRLLDIKHLFQGAIEPSKAYDIFEPKQKRNREGYDDDVSLVRKVFPAAEFVWSSDDPVETLGKVTSISFGDDSSLPLKEHPLTTEEVITLCEDLRVLGKQDFKQLLKWRINIRKALSPIGKTTFTVVNIDQENKNVDKEEDEDGDEDGNEDEKVLNEMEQLTHDVERKKKREKKILAKRRAKDKARKATGMQIDALQDGYVDNELFSLASIKGKDDLATIDTTVDVEGDELAGSDDDADNEADEDSESSDLDSDEERSRYDEQLDKVLDEAYERFLAKNDGSTKQRNRAKEAYSDMLTVGSDDDNNDVDQPDDDSDNGQVDKEANPLVVPIDEDRELTQEEIKNRWYSQDIFTEAVEGGDLGKDSSDEDELQIAVQKKKIALRNKAKDGSKPHSLGSEAPKNRAAKIQDLEVVPAPVTDSSSSSDDESEDYDTDTKCEVLAAAKKMLRKRKRDEILDDGYNKRTFDDQGLPSWFAEDEKRHNQPLKPVTKEEIDAEKARFKEINARPAKKVAEAKARKKRAVMRTMEKVRKKANTIADQNDLPDRSKSRMINQLYKKAVTPRKPKKELVVAKKGVQVRAGKGKLLVDRRMKSDARQQGMNKQSKKGSGKGKGAGKGSVKGKGKGKGSMKGSSRSGVKGKM
ncbi:adoMet-dependent rRNA methyltransferase spb1-like [Chenopodium quinoa]|uniref:adoMet-dependent rRNA methyltransferase spb1-like n=1 Tax=Chenopodium quinoa TaxID=63459 RepID=UPI000B78017E|nr:adoMet-dependent rRNA methyltransferase spb1-like [Chenopodium quinoa]